MAAIEDTYIVIDSEMKAKNKKGLYKHILKDICKVVTFSAISLPCFGDDFLNGFLFLNKCPV